MLRKMNTQLNFETLYIFAYKREGHSIQIQRKPVNHILHCYSLELQCNSIINHKDIVQKTPAENFPEIKCYTLENHYMDDETTIIFKGGIRRTALQCSNTLYSHTATIS